MPNPSEHELEQQLNQLGTYEPNADVARRAIERTRQALEKSDVTPATQPRRTKMTWKLSLAALLLLAITAAAGGAWWQLAEETSHTVKPGPVNTDPVEQDDRNDGDSDALAIDDAPLQPKNETPAEEIVENDSIEILPETAVDVVPEVVIETPEPDPVPQVADAQWGHLSGTFVLSGEAPEAKPIRLTADLAVCGKHSLVDESLVVDPESRGVRNVILFMYLKRGGDEAPQPHPDYEASAEDEVVLDNVHCRFEPHVTLLRTSQTLLVRNSDTVGHNTKINALVGNPLNPLIPAGGELKFFMDTPERLPVQVGCNIHPWMRGWIVVRESPYMAVTDARGKFRIENLPVGKWQFQVWHEQMGYVSDVAIDGKPVDWSRGRVEVEIKGGETDLGEISLTVNE